MATLAEKLKLKENTKVLLVNAPKGSEKTISPLPKGVSFSAKPAKENHFIFLFVTNKAELEKLFTKTTKFLATDGLIWILYPKGTSGIQTDLTRDKGWECLQEVNMQWLSLISYDDTWSAFLMKNSPLKKEENKASKEYHDNVSKWIDTTKKIVKVPADFESVLLKGKVKAIFDALAFSHRKEYVIWIVSAKQEATRNDRMKKAVEKLKAGKKNPAEK